MKEVKIHHPTVQLDLSLGVNADTKEPYIALRWGGMLEKATHMDLVVGVDGWVFIYNKNGLFITDTSDVSEIETLRPIITSALVDYLLELKHSGIFQSQQGVTKKSTTRLATAVGVPIDFVFNTALSSFFDSLLRPKTPHRA